MVILQRVVKENGALFYASAPSILAASHLIIVPLHHTPTQDTRATFVTDLWLERCLDARLYCRLLTLIFRAEHGLIQNQTFCTGHCLRTRSKLTAISRNIY
jgi:hypothetical protein